MGGSDRDFTSKNPFVIINVTNCSEAEVDDLREHQRAALIM